MLEPPAGVGGSGLGPGPQQTVLGSELTVSISAKQTSEKNSFRVKSLNVSVTPPSAGGRNRSPTLNEGDFLLRTEAGSEKFLRRR